MPRVREREFRAGRLASIVSRALNLHAKVDDLARLVMKYSDRAIG